MRPASLRRKSTSVTVIGNVAVGSYRAVSAAAAAARALGAPAASSTPAPRAIIVITKPRRPARWLSMRLLGAADVHARRAAAARDDPIGAFEDYSASTSAVCRSHRRSGHRPHRPERRARRESAG